ncbi:MAG: hypothetical protein ACRDYA_10090 [Egibacteraceae bacterium]
MAEAAYQGIPLTELRIEAVDWTHRAEHIRHRSRRHGPDEFDVEPEWATEAALDARRLVAVTEGRSIVVLGRSVSARPRDCHEEGRILKVWLVPADLETGLWWGASACDANARDRKLYGEGQ